MLKILSRNVNWLRAILKKGFLDFLKQEQPDILGLQEIEVHPDQMDQFVLDEIKDLGYHLYFNPAEKKGYSGTAIFSKIKPLNVFKWINLSQEEFKDIIHTVPGLRNNNHYKALPEEIENVIHKDNEWRVLTAEFDDFFFTTVYTPNAKWDLSRLDFRQIWDAAFLKYMKKLEEKKPVIFCGDLNVAHKEIDLKNPKANQGSHWFTLEERQGFENFIKNGFIDTFRYFYPDKEWAYSWWSYFGKARQNNSGWRIDYILISKQLLPYLKEAFILNQIEWSDHCPVWISLDK